MYSKMNANETNPDSNPKLNELPLGLYIFKAMGTEVVYPKAWKAPENDIKIIYKYLPVFPSTNLITIINVANINELDPNDKQKM